MSLIYLRDFSGFGWFKVIPAAESNYQTRTTLPITCLFSLWCGLSPKLPLLVLAAFGQRCGGDYFLIRQNVEVTKPDFARSFPGLMAENKGLVLLNHLIFTAGMFLTGARSNG